MKGIARTQKEIEFHDRVAALGCISCRQEGIFNTHVSIHHAHGRTKPGCHMWVLPLCEPHHQDNGTAIARHPYKRRWEAKYGNEDELIRQMWTELGIEFTEPVRVAKPVDRNKPKKLTSAAVEIGVVKLKSMAQKEGDKINRKEKSPAAAKESESSPARPKARIQSRGFDKSSNSKISSRSKIPAPKKQPMSEKQVAYLAERKAASKAYKLKMREEYKEKVELLAKISGA
ncbi:Ref family recombination enhancement nuclease [Pseudomonas putida]|uniref:Recombinase n=1 Tax=Pseudomonas putida TaxID=303 RepID=A0A8I1JJF3_PSEPU|nr:Ref family recombination enhancement nuclease [Pseudomonas putida]MBI6882325.1 hypothetical protein [Pseudomonas putida]